MFSNDFADKVASRGDLREYLKIVDVSSLRIPKDIEKILNLKAGDEVDIWLEESKIIIQPVARASQRILRKTGELY